MSDTTVVLTSCGRQDLLQRTIASFLRYNSAPLQKFIIIEDGSAERNRHLQEIFSSDLFVWLATGDRVGQIHAIDQAYRHVRTPYIFHCEDDWEFYAPGFIELSALVLDQDRSWLQVYIRALGDIYGHPLFEEEHTAGAARFRVLTHDWDAASYGRWHGFAFNPGLRRRSDYERVGAYGACARFHPDKPWEAERTISEVYRDLGFWATILTNNGGSGFVRHAGEDRHVGPANRNGATQERPETNRKLQDKRELTFRPGIVCSGSYSTWTDALAASTGYYLPEFVERTRQAALRVKRGEAAYERDSVLFDQIQPHFPLLDALLRAALEQQNTLTVLDFGGGFGTSYHQCRRFLEPIRSLRWLIVDQPSHVEHGRRDFASDELRFFGTPEQVFSEFQPNVLLLSGVLPCVPSPYELLGDLMRRAIPYLVIDRTFFLVRGVDRLTVQHGPFEIYPGSYPAWFLSESRVLETITAGGYDLLTAFDGFDRIEPEDEPAYAKGFVFRYSGEAINADPVKRITR